MAKTCFGEIMQVHNRNNFELTEDQYFRIIEGKTAELYATSAMLGAAYAGANEAVAQAFYDYGMNLGRAFQIMDDLLDLLGEEALVGKTLGSDVEKGKPTLPLIHHLHAIAPAQRKASLEAARAGRRADLLPLLHGTGSFKYAAGVANRLVASAKSGLDVMAVNPLRDLLDEVADFVLAREA